MAADLVAAALTDAGRLVRLRLDLHGDNGPIRAEIAYTDFDTPVVVARPSANQVVDDAPDGAVVTFTLR